MGWEAALVAAVTVSVSTAATARLPAAAVGLLPVSRLARSSPVRRPAPTPRWAGPGRQRRTWPEQLHPGSGPRKRPRRP